MSTLCKADGKQLTRKKVIVRPKSKSTFKELLGLASKEQQTGCALCKAYTDSSPNDSSSKIYQDDQFTVTAAKHSAGRSHLLIIPKRHIGCVDQLEETEEDRDLIKKMWKLGEDFLQAKDAEANEQNMKCGFHTPLGVWEPHLHMHCMVLPHKPDYAKYQFQESTFLTQGYVSVQQVLARLGSPVKLKTC